MFSVLIKFIWWDLPWGNWASFASILSNLFQAFKVYFREEHWIENQHVFFLKISHLNCDS